MDNSVISFFFSLDKHLADFIQNYGLWTYLALFLMVFLETAIVLMAFLPGDTLLFAAGTMAAVTDLQIGWVIGLICLAAVLGNFVAFYLGRWLTKATLRERSRWVKAGTLEKAHAFFKKWGGWSITMARFYPILRAVVPLAAGMSGVKTSTFALFNVLGALVWGVGITLLGYFFGNIPVIRKNIALIAVIIIVISLVPFVVAWLKKLLGRPAEKDQAVTRDEGT